MLTQQHTKLIHNLAVKQNQVVSLDEALQNEAKELESEKGRSSDLGNRLRELSGLYRAISAVNASTDDSNTFDAVLTAALELVDANCGSLMLIDSNRQHLVIAAHEGLDDSVANRTAQPIGDGIAGWVAQNGEALLLNGGLDTLSHGEDLRPAQLGGDPERSPPGSGRGKVYRLRLKGKLSVYEQTRFFTIFTYYSRFVHDVKRIAISDRCKRYK